MKIEINSNTVFYHEKEAYSGVTRAAKNVMHDMELIFGRTPAEYVIGKHADTAIIYGTVGKSRIIDALNSSGKINISQISNKWEVYSVTVVSEPVDGIDTAIVIAGSDKRGTIYGLYHLSELMGVSPLV